METATRTETPATPPRPVDRERWRRLAVALGGPALIVGSVLFAMRGFAFVPNLTNQHPDILTFWLPRSCLMGRALASGHVPLWNPFEMAGTPFAADPQSGWLYLPSMATSWAFGCGDGLRAFIVLNPVLAGLGLWWFLRREGLGRIAATAGGLSLAMAMSASSVAVSLPFAGTLAWTPVALVGASGYFSSAGWRRLGWLALTALAWGQVASAHLSHGLVMCTSLLVAYVLARAVRDVRARILDARTAVALALVLLAFLPLANLAILIPRFVLTDRSSLRAGYGAFTGTVANPGLVGEDRPIPNHGIWSAWPLALASTPGAYVGASILLAIPLAVRDGARRFLVVAFAAVGVVTYLGTITLLVGAGWFRAVVTRIPFGDVYLHNPGRFRYVGFVVAAVLGAIGIQALLDHRMAPRAVLRWFGAPFAIFVAWPLVAGANGLRLLVFAIAAAAVLAVWWSLAVGRRWARAAVIGVLAAELLASATYSSAYAGGTVYFGLEGSDHPALVPGPLRWPDVPLGEYLAPTPISRAIAASGGRYLAWIQPAAVFNKGYLFSQSPNDWPALLLGRAIIFRIDDALGYSPIQLPRYWAYIRETNRLPVFYNAAVIQEPSPTDIRLLGVRSLIVSEASQVLPRGITGRVIARDHGYLLLALDQAEPRVSVVPSWHRVDDGRLALEAVSVDDFDPALEAVVEGSPPVAPVPGAVARTATYREAQPEDVTVDVSTATPAIVTIRNAWDRGWSATLDGRPVTVYRTDYLLQGIAVPPGDHEIRLTYRESTIGVGLLASAVAWAGAAAGFAAAWALARRRRRASGPA
jgi:hypothetical protein